MKILCEHIVNTNEYAGTVDLITGVENFKSQVEYNSEWHTYKLNGKIIPSVTSLLDNGEYNDVDEEILRNAQLRGTLIHKEIQEYLESDINGYTNELYGFIDLFINNKKMFERVAIWDFKTYATATPSKREKCYKQLKMYAEAIEYLTGIKIENKYMIHLPKNKKARIYDLREEFENDKEEKQNTSRNR